MEYLDDNLPYEVQLQIMKYTRHPMAELFINSDVVKDTSSAVDAHIESIESVSFSHVFFIMLELT